MMKRNNKMDYWHLGMSESRISSFRIRLCTTFRNQIIWFTNISKIKNSKSPKIYVDFGIFLETHLLPLGNWEIGTTRNIFLTKKYVTCFTWVFKSLIPINCKLIRGLRLRLAAVFYHSRQFSSMVDKQKKSSSPNVYINSV